MKLKLVGLALMGVLALRAQIVTINDTDLISASRATLNSNFSYHDTNKVTGAAATGASDTVLLGQGVGVAAAWAAITACTGAGKAVTYDTAAHAFGCNTTVTQTIASGTSALGTGAIASATCATVVTTTATGTASTDAIIWTPNASIKAVTGYVPATTGGLTIAAYPTTNAVNFDVCNWTSGSITPGAVTLNWRVVR